MPKAASSDSPKRPANLSVKAHLLAQARQLDINLSATLEQALIATIRQRQRELWKAKHQGAIQAYNAQVDELGVFSDGLRSF